MEDREKVTLSQIHEVLKKEKAQVEEYDAIRMSLHTFEVDVDRALEHLKSCKESAEDATKASDAIGKEYVDSTISMGFGDEKSAREKLNSIESRCEDKEFVSKLAPSLKCYAETCAKVRSVQRKANDSKNQVKEAEERLRNVKTKMKEVQEKIHHTAEELETLQVVVLEPMFRTKQVDKFRLRELCREIGGIPSLLRPKVWPILLGVVSNNSNIGARADVRLCEEIRDTKRDLKTQRIIEADVDRTRQIIPYFRRKSVKSLMNRLLTFYCKRRSLEYTQGLHELCAPFVWMYRTNEKEEEEEKENDTFENEATMFKCFYAFVTNFLPTMFSGKDFSLLNASLRFYELLLQYHDPKLSNLLLQYGLRSQLYATPWFVTLFAHTLPLKHIYSVWDMYIIEGSPFVHHFVSVSLLQSQSHSLMSAESGTDGRVQISRDLLMEQLMMNKDMFQHDGFGNVRQLTCRARSLLATTPKSFYQMLQRVCYRLDGTLPDEILVKRLEAMICLEVKPRELLQVEKSLQRTRKQQDSSSPGTSRLGDNLKYFVFDCRAQKEYDRAHFSLSFHLDPSLLSVEGAGEFDRVLKQFEALRKSACLCFMDSGKSTRRPVFTLASGLETNNNNSASMSIATRFALFFIQRGYERVGLVPGGFAACEDIVKSSPALRSLLIENENISRGGDVEKSDSSAESVLSAVVSRLFSSSNSTTTQHSTRQNLKAPILSSIDSIGSTTSKSEDPTILVSFEGSDRIDAFGVEYREIKYLPPSNLRSCKWNALSWKRASTDRAVPASGEIGSKCMYLLGTRSDETLRRGVFYQIHHVTYDDLMDKWSDWSKPSEPFALTLDAKKQDINIKPRAQDIDETNSADVSPVMPCLPNEYNLSFKEKRSFGMVLRGVKAPSMNAKIRVFVIGVDRDSLAFHENVQAGDEIVAVDNLLVGDSLLQDLDHVITYIRKFHKNKNVTNISFRFRRVDFPQRELAAMSVTSSSPSSSSSSSSTTTTKIKGDNANSTKKKVGRWLKKRLSSGNNKKSSWKKSLGGMWAKATAAASNASKNLRNMKSSDDDPASYGLVPLAEWKRDIKQVFFEAKDKNDVTCCITSSKGHVVVLQNSEMFEGWASVQVKFHVNDLAKITSRKSTKNSVIFHVKDADTGIISEHFFVVSEKKACVKTIREEFYNAKKRSTSLSSSSSS